MNENKLDKVDRLIKIKKINEAQRELAKLGPEFMKNSEYLYLRSKIFYTNKLYYIALDTLLIATEFDEQDKIYKWADAKPMLKAWEANQIKNKREACKIWWTNYKNKLQESIKKRITS